MRDLGSSPDITTGLYEMKACSLLNVEMLQDCLWKIYQFIECN